MHPLTPCKLATKLSISSSLISINGIKRAGRLTAMLLGFSMLIAASNVASAIALDASEQLKSVTNSLIRAGTYSRDELKGLMGNISLDKGVLKLMDKQWEAKPWHKYKKIFINDERTAKGVEFWNKNEELLNAVSDEYGVPPKILVALLGVETYYGKRMGSKSVFRSLVTLTAGYPRRAEFFGSELRKFLTIVKQEKLVAADVKGSFAGAIGIPQFMPSSYDAYAVDFNQNGKRDLVNELPDAVGSVANYLTVHGWKKGQPIRQWLTEPLSAGLKAKVVKKAKPKTSLASLKAAGLQLGLNVDRSGKEKVALLRLKEDDGWHYFIGHKNFYAITRYNPSSKYAMAIVELSEAISAKRAL